MTRFLPYFVARHAALELDREGKRPGLLVTALRAVASASTLGLLCCVAFVLGWTGLAMLGLVH